MTVGGLRPSGANSQPGRTSSHVPWATDATDITSRLRARNTAGERTAVSRPGHGLFHFRLVVRSRDPADFQGCMCMYVWSQSFAMALVQHCGRTCPSMWGACRFKTTYTSTMLRVRLADSGVVVDVHVLASGFVFVQVHAFPPDSSRPSSLLLSLFLMFLVVLVAFSVVPRLRSFVPSSLRLPCSISLSRTLVRCISLALSPMPLSCFLPRSLALPPHHSSTIPPLSHPVFPPASLPLSLPPSPSLSVSFLRLPRPLARNHPLLHQFTSLRCELGASTTEEWGSEGT